MAKSRKDKETLNLQRPVRGFVVIGLNSMNIATIDFETRSPADLKKVGAYLYAKHKNTEAMCLAYKAPNMPHVGLWHMEHTKVGISESEPPNELFKHILSGGLVEAHNAFFEWAIWSQIMVPRYGWPSIPDHQWRCSASKASALALPRSLEGAAQALNLPVQKDMDGRKLMLRMCKPRASTKGELSESGLLFYHESPEELARLWEYCKTDVLTEIAVSEAIPDLNPQELEVWLLDQKMNRHGVKFDLDLARSALIVADQWKKKLNSELTEITGLLSATQRAKVVAWLAENENLTLPDTKAPTVAWFLSRPLTPRAKKVLRIVTDVNKTSVRKYQTMLEKADPSDWRIRDLLMYHGASTGRWAGKGVQVQNFPARDLIIKDFEESAELIKEQDPNWIYVLYEDVIKVVSGALRGAIIPSDGKQFYVADYAAIEARVVLWLAGAKSALQVFEKGEDIYCDMASTIYGYQVCKGMPERQFGKQAILGLGFGMGFVTFFLTCRSYGIHFSLKDAERIVGRAKLHEAKAELFNKWYDPDPKERAHVKATLKRLEDVREDPKQVLHELVLMKYVVNTYRNKYQEIKDLWHEQESAAMTATVEGTRVQVGLVSWFVEDGFLYCELPSGRRLAYRDPQVKMVSTSWGEKRKGLRYMGVTDSGTKKWGPVVTYGGKLVENITQAIARDVMANALLNLDRSGIYQPVMTIHDEIVCEAAKDKGNQAEFAKIMVQLPAWAKGFPCSVDTACLNRYQKL